MNYYLAIDIGASSGRHIIGWKDDLGRIRTHEVYRFYNGMELQGGHRVWDIEAIFSEVKRGIALCLKEYRTVESMSIDTWGVDYVLMNGDVEILPVYAYRDARTKESIPVVHSRLPFKKMYEISGTQFQEFNTVYQLYWDKMHHRLDHATEFLMIPEYLIYRLTGVKKKEYTNASTTGMTELQSGAFSFEILRALDLPEHLFPELQLPGETVGGFTKEIQEEVGGNIPVVLCASHDTASAVEGIPMNGRAPYISSGTWSLLGIPLKEGIASEKARNTNYSNERGPGYIRFQKNIMGLWMIQCLGKELKADFSEMISLAKQSRYAEVLDVDDPCFLRAESMRMAVQSWFEARGRPAPAGDGDILQTVYRSLAASYASALAELEEITRRRFSELYIVGGGAKNEYLNALTERYTGKRVVALPIEATAIGNLRIQMEGRR